MNLTEHFTLDEFTKTTYTEYQEANKTQAMAYIEPLTRVCVELERLRLFVFRPVYIYSGFRYPELNFKVGGSKTSQHMVGEAADFSVKDFTDISGIGFIFDWCRTHLDYSQLILECPVAKIPWIHIGLPVSGKNKVAMVFDGSGYKKI